MNFSLLEGTILYHDHRNILYEAKEISWISHYILPAKISLQSEHIHHLLIAHVWFQRRRRTCDGSVAFVRDVREERLIETTVDAIIVDDDQDDGELVPGVSNKNLTQLSTSTSICIFRSKYCTKYMVQIIIFNILQNLISRL